MSDQALDLDLAAHAPPAQTLQLVETAAGDRLYVVPDTGYARVVKPAFDRLAALLLLVVAVPVLLVAVLAVRFQLGAGVFYRQERIGVLGRRFTVLKLRTMHHDRRVQQVSFVGDDRRQTHKTLDDPRHTSLGQFLRKWSIDELPQLVNVVRGEMSLVGPRPELPEVAQRHYESWCHQRHAVKPGVTGLWQITKRGELEMHDPASLEIDVQYTQQVSFLGDLKILLGTIPAMLGGSRGQ